MEHLNPKGSDDFKEEQEEVQFLNVGGSPAETVTPHHPKGDGHETIWLFLLTLGLFAGAAYAHNGMDHVMGTVTAKIKSSVSVKTMNAELFRQSR